MAHATIAKVLCASNAPETILEHKGYEGELVKYVKWNCEGCEYYKAKCRVEDSRGLTPMSLCIQLYILQQTKPDMGLLKNMLETGNISEDTLTEIESA